jgi:DNA-binding HxlR family transcriptional regulator
MSSYGQFCAMARAHEVLGGRWTLLVLRELLCGSRRFNEIRRGIPRISRTVLSERLRELVACGAVESIEGRHGPEYALTAAGRELETLVGAMAVWGQRWLPRHADREDLDLEPLLLDMTRRVRREALPRDPIVIRYELRGSRARFMLLTSAEASVCAHNPGFPEPLKVGGPLGALAGWWRGDMDFPEARRTGLSVEGPKPLVRAFPTWFSLYAFADTAPAGWAQPAPSEAPERQTVAARATPEP